jgi:hypothetical protein
MIIDDTSIIVCDVVQSSVCSFFRLFREDLMGLYISVEAGTITNTDLVQLMGNIGLVCILSRTSVDCNVDIQNDSRK